MPKRSQPDDAGRNVRPRVDTKLPANLVAAVTQVAAGLDMTTQTPAVQAFVKDHIVPGDPEGAGEVASWCAYLGLEEQLVHVINVVALSELKVFANTSLVARCLKRCPSLVGLELREPLIESEQLMAMANALKERKNFVKLWMISPDPDPSGKGLKTLISAVAVTPTLQSLVVAVQSCAPDWALDLAKVLTARKSALPFLMIEYAGLLTPHLDALCSAITNNPTLALKALGLAGNQFDDAKALIPFMRASPSLEILNLSGNASLAVDAVICSLGQGYRGRVHTLCLGDMRFTGSGERTRFITSISSALGVSTTLKELGLGSNGLHGFQSPDVIILRAAIEANSTLKTLNLDGNSFSPAAIDQLVASLQHNHALELVTFVGNTPGALSEEQLEAVQAVIARNKAEGVAVPGESNAGAGPFASAKASLAIMQRRSEAYERMLERMMNEPAGFEHITMACRSLSQAGVVILPDEMNALLQAADPKDGQRLKLIDAIQATDFTSRPTKEHVSALLKDAKGELSAALKRFGGIDAKLPPKLLKGVTEAAGRAPRLISAEEEALRAFVHDGTLPFNDSDAREVARWCAEYNLEEQFVQVVNAAGLRVLRLTVGLPLVTRCLKRCETLESLELLNANINNDQFVRLADVLKELKTFESLSVCHCNINVDGQGLTAVVKALAANTSVRTFVVINAACRLDWIHELARVLKTRTSALTYLALQYVGLTIVELRELGSAIAGNPKLAPEVLSFSGNRFDSADPLIPVIRNHASLTELDLSDAPARVVNGVALLLSKEYHGPLRSLYLRNMTFADGAEIRGLIDSMSILLTVNTTLKHLDLRNNNLFASETITFLSGAIAANSTLETLNFDRNVTHVDVMSIFVRHLADNIALTSVTFEPHAQIPDATQVEEIEKITTRNQARRIAVTGEYIEGAAIAFATGLQPPSGVFHLPQDIGVRIGAYLAGGKTPGELRKATRLVRVSKATYQSAVQRRSGALGTMLKDMMKEPDGFEHITRACRLLSTVGVAILPEDMNTLLQAATPANGQRLKLINAIQASGLKSRPAKEHLAALLKDAKGDLAIALKDFGA